MILESTFDHLGPAAADRITLCHAAGRRLAESAATPLHGKRAPKPHGRQADRIFAHAASTSESARAWLLDNARLLDTAAKQANEFATASRELPVVAGPSGEELRVSWLARAYLDCSGLHFTEDTCVAFLNGFQESATLQIAEIWALKFALQNEILGRLEDEHPEIPELVASLQRIGETVWKDLLESASKVDRVFAADPVEVYARMDSESRDRYRGAVAALAKQSACTEQGVAEAALKLAHDAYAHNDGSRAALRRSHVGYYLIDGGLPLLKARIGYRPSPASRLRDGMLRFPTSFYLVGIELLTFFAVALLISKAGYRTPHTGGLLLLLLPATQIAVDFMNHLVTYLLPPRALPKLDFSLGVPDDCATMVAVPSLLLTEAQVRELVLHLEIRFLANRDPNIYFALVTVTPDSDRRVDERDALVSVCRRLIEELNRRYPESPFFLFHRHRTYNDSEGRWMGWERKRGKLLDLNQLLHGGFDSFPVKVGTLDVLPRIRYVITVDSDTQLPRDRAAMLIGAIAHPLNAAVVHPVHNVVTEGYGILQPRIGVSIRSSARSRLAALYSGETGFDIYTRAVSDVYQDLFGEGIFTGKGIYDVEVMRTVLERRFPDNALLSHDLIEGAYARAALVSDIEMIEDYPSHFSAFNRRKHRWVRGDWQILRWILPRVPDYTHHLVPNPVTLISRWKIVDNLRRSLFDPSLLLLLLGAWFALPGAPAYWTGAAIAVLFLPVYCDFFFSLLRMPRRRNAFRAWASDTLRAFANGHAIALFGLIFLLHQALLSIDAITRSILRVFVTRRKLLEWETAAEAEAATRSKATVDVYLEWTPWIGAALALLVWLVRPHALPAAAPVLCLWIGSRACSAWLNRAPRTMKCTLEATDSEWLRLQAENIWRYFHDWSSPGTNWLIPDSVNEDGKIDFRLSPTNLGLLLNARIAAVKFGLMKPGEFVFQTRQTLDRMVSLRKYRGHLLNWYDIQSLEPLRPHFISTVDSGNLAAALWTLKQAVLDMASKPWAEGIAAELEEIASVSDTLVREMDFAFLYRARRKVLSVGFDISSGRLDPSCYDLLASEARIAVFVAIAKGDIPQEAWFHLGRAHTLSHGNRSLLSWTGTMFEYLMPALWMKHAPGTLTRQSLDAVVRIHRAYCSRKAVPWGISESAWLGAGPRAEPGYAPFGIPGLALRRRQSEALVIAPYASFLALLVDPQSACKNLRQMDLYGWSGLYGLYEAAQYSAGGAEPIRSWMAHHQGMALLALCNLFFDSCIQRHFHAEPQVLATELLLDERIPAALGEAEARPALESALQAAGAA